MPARISPRRQAALRTDAPYVHQLYAEACDRFGVRAVQESLALLWTLRCMQGCDETLPFHQLESRTIGELLWVARAVCRYC